MLFKKKEAFVFLVLYKVFVLQCSCIFKGKVFLTFDLSVDHATLEIKDSSYIAVVLTFPCEAHKNEIDGVLIVNFY